MQVTIIIPVFNAVKFVCKAVESTLIQPETGEVLLVEDGSTDGSLTLCEELVSRYRKVRLLQHADGCNRGVSASRNLGLVEARYEFIAFLDADDFMLENRFFAAKQRFKEFSQVDGVYDPVRLMFTSEKDRLQWIADKGYEVAAIRENIPPDLLFSALLKNRKGHFNTAGIVFRRELLEHTGLFCVDMTTSEDTLLWHKMAAVGRLFRGNATTPVAVYRIHPENTVNRRAAEMQANRIEMYYRLHFWLKENNLCVSERSLIVDAILHTRRLLNYKDTITFRNRIDIIRFLLRLLILIPRSVSSSKYRESMVKAFGLWRVVNSGLYKTFRSYVNCSRDRKI